MAESLSTEQIEERRTNLRAFRAMLFMKDDSQLTTTLLMQEEWLATVDELQERLNRYTYVLDGHLLWGGTLDGDGYGRLTVDGKPRLTHRLAWEIAYGPIPSGIHTLHLCDVPPCILPWHLYLGTHVDNMHDMLHAGTHYNTNKTHCPQGHAYNEENTYLWEGRRYCRVCDRERQGDARRAGWYTKGNE